MGKVFFVLILGQFLFSSAVVADDLAEYEKECLSVIEEPKVTVLSSYGKLQYKFDKDAAYLKRETEKKFKDQGEEMSAEFVPIGLTKVHDMFDFDMTVGQIEISKGYLCVFPTDIKVKLEYYMPTIYILDTLEKGSCFYELALRHEKTHMQIYIEALDYFLPMLKKQADSVFHKVGVKVFSREESAETAAKELNEQYLEVVKKNLDKWRSDVEKEQLKLDTPEHYIIENTICKKFDEEGYE